MGQLSERTGTIVSRNQLQNKWKKKHQCCTVTSAVLIADRTFLIDFLKGQSNEIFDVQFFSLFEPVWVTDQWVKIFSVLVEISLRYSNLKFV